MTRSIRKIMSLALITAGALSLTACGLRGDLERPDPLWGDRPAQEDSEG
jgi:predicted small lipoprotein YifL